MVVVVVVRTRLAMQLGICKTTGKSIDGVVVSESGYRRGSMPSWLTSDRFQKSSRRVALMHGTGTSGKQMVVDTRCHGR